MARTLKLGRMEALSHTRAALQGIRVIDLTTVVFGPYATQILADYGAEVIKIEAPEGDSTRYTGPAHEYGMASLFLGVNRNKHSVVLDLKLPDAREALLALTDGADVFIHNIRPQALARLGLSAELLRNRNPRLVFVSLHGFGQEGPYAGLPAYDDIIQALSGVADLTARQSGEARYFPTIMADKTCAQMAAHAVLAALFQRERTGQGQAIEIPMFESTASFLLVEHFYAGHLSNGEPAPERRAASYGYPRTLAGWRRPWRTSDGHVCVMPYSDENWRRFFTATGQPELASDPRFIDIGARTANIAALYAIAAETVSGAPTAYWIDLCRNLQIPCAAINSLQDLECDPHLQAVDFFKEIGTADGLIYRYPRNPVRMSDSAVAPSAPPRLGQDTEAVLGSLGLAPALLERLLSPARASTQRPAADICPGERSD